MRISLNYIKSILPWRVDENLIEDGFKVLGLEVEEIFTRNNVTGSVFGKIVQIDDIGEKLRIAQVNILSKQVIQIVTKSEKAIPGAIVAVAPIGAKISGINVEGRTVRGNKTEGILLTAEDYQVDPETLPLKERIDIWTFPDDTPLYTDPNESMWLSDKIYTLKITPNHPEWLSIRGIVREIAVALWQKTGQINNIPNLDVKPIKIDCLKQSPIKLDIEDERYCRRYFGVLADVIPMPSCFEMRKKLLASCQRPINNIVDASNISMIEDGLPTHAFDANTIKSGIIRVAITKVPTIFTTLDGLEREIPIGTLMIWDGDKPIAIAGIMGGSETEVTENTKQIFLEAAHFEPLTIAKTSILLGLRSEASIRFEKGVDWEQPEKTAMKTLSLCGAKACVPVEFFNNKTKKIVELRTDRMKKILGFDLPTQKVVDGFSILGIRTTVNGSIKAIIPGFRDNDLLKEIDLIEEAIRVIGYDKIPTTLPSIEVSVFSETQIYMLERRMRHLMLGQGFSECYSKTWTCDEELCQYRLETYRNKTPIIVNPITTDGTTMKPLLEVGLLDIALYNIRKRNTNLALFEIGSQFGPEQRVLSTLLMGSPLESWDEGIVKKELQTKILLKKTFDFYDLKGHLETLFNQLLLSDRIYKQSHKPHLHPYRQAEIFIENVCVGYIGELHPYTMSKLDFINPCLISNVNIEAILRFVPGKLDSKPISKFPEVYRDIAVLAPNDISEQDIERVIKDICKDKLKEILLFDQFKGQFADDNKQSLAFSLKFSDDDGTLIGEQIDEMIKHIDQALHIFGAHLRKA